MLVLSAHENFALDPFPLLCSGKRFASRESSDSVSSSRARIDRGSTGLRRDFRATGLHAPGRLRARRLRRRTTAWSPIFGAALRPAQSCSRSRFGKTLLTDSPTKSKSSSKPRRKTGLACALIKKTHECNRAFTKRRAFLIRSGHATNSEFFALTLAHIYADRDAALFFSRADQLGADRVLGGMHHPTDICGRATARARTASRVAGGSGLRCAARSAQPSHRVERVQVTVNFEKRSPSDTRSSHHAPQPHDVGKAGRAPELRDLGRSRSPEGKRGAGTLVKLAVPAWVIRQY